MANFNITRENANEKIVELLGIFSNDKLTETDWSDCIKKLKSAIDSYQDSEIKIALMGSFSDGKTSTIAGMMGELLDDMIIDVDESSDQLTVYRPKGLKEGFVIIDTPGLFGTKEKKVDGKNIKFSKQTEEFISEADIILYVTDATVPIIDDHKEIMQKVLRTYNKLDKTLFVLNKMDAIVNPKDEVEYEVKAKIKTEALMM
jgi:predicted GTPase